MNKMGLKIIALGCILLMISGLFLPFVSVNGYTTTLFDGTKELNYYPYILIGFSLLSAIVILLNKKIEFAYLLIGSSLTFVITTTIGSIESFKMFSIGYYLIALSTILLFLMLILLSMKSDEKIVVKKDEPIEKIEESINFENVEPNELAKSIMSEPVMKSSIDINNELNSNIPVEPKINFDEINNEEVTLAPQNPLNSFLPSDFDPSKIVKEEENDIDNEVKVEEKNSVNEDINQSIMSVMSQPMVNSNLNTTIVEPKPMNIPNIQQSTFGQNNQQQSTNVPVMEPTMPSQPLNVGQQPHYNSQVVEPQVNTNIPYQSFTQNNNQ